VTAQVRLAKYVIKGSPGFSIFVPGDLHTNNLGIFSPSATLYSFLNLFMSICHLGSESSDPVESRVFGILVVHKQKVRCLIFV
jgi:hypothetical protein